MRHHYMNLRHILLCLCLFAGITVPATAQHVSEQTALERANAFLQEPTSSMRKAMRKAPRKAPRLKAAVTRDEFYIFNDEANQGFVIVSGEERTPDILGYSDEGCFDSSNIPDNVQAWLDGYAEQIQAIAASPSKAEEVEVSFSREPIVPLLKTSWGQGNIRGDYPYNLLTPTYGAAHCVTGCVATAMAQVMNYWKHPQQTTAEIPVPSNVSSNTSLTYNGGAIPAGTKIDWDNMLPDYGNFAGTEAQKQAVAQLMLECGLAVNMEYGLMTSGAFGSDIKPALVNYFGYTSECRLLEKEQFDYTDWLYILYNELRHGRPILYGAYCKFSDSGHQFVCDGYATEDYFHINWGWNGELNGYFRIELKDDVLGKSCYKYSYEQNSLLGVQPNKYSSNATLLAVKEILIGQSTYTRSSTSANFTGISITPRLFMTTTGNDAEYAIALEKDGQTINILNAGTSDLQIGDIRENSVSLQFGANLENGIYQLVPVCRRRGDTTWQHDTDADHVYVDASISGNTLTLSYPLFTSQQANLTCISTPTVTGNYSPFEENVATYKIRNNGNKDFFGKLTLFATSKKTGITSAVAHHSVNIKAGQISEVSISFTFCGDISQTTYQFTLGYGEIIEGSDFTMTLWPELKGEFDIPALQDAILENGIYRLDGEHVVVDGVLTLTYPQVEGYATAIKDSFLLYFGDTFFMFEFNPHAIPLNGYENTRRIHSQLKKRIEVNLNSGESIQIPFSIEYDYKTSTPLNGCFIIEQLHYNNAESRPYLFIPKSAPRRPEDHNPCANWSGPLIIGLNPSMLKDNITIKTSVYPTDGGSISEPEEYYYSVGETVTFVANPNSDENYALDYWALKSPDYGYDNIQYITTDTVTLTVNKSHHEYYLAAYFKKVFWISAIADSAHGGAITGSGIYKDGEYITLRAVPAEGYNFECWTEDGNKVSTNPNYYFQVSKERHLVAHFEKKTYCNIRVKADPSNGGTITLISYNYHTGIRDTIIANPANGGIVSGRYEEVYTDITITATPAEGYEFVKWTMNDLDWFGHAQDATFVDLAVGDVNYVAHFRKNESYTITATADPVYGGRVTGAGTYKDQDEVWLSATPKLDWEFVNWTEDGTVVSTDETYIFKATRDRDLVANFRDPSVSTYTVTYQIKYNNKVVATAQETVGTGEALPDMPESLKNDFVTLSKSGSYPSTVTKDITVTFVATWNGPFQFTQSLTDATWYVMHIRNGYYIGKQDTEPYKPAKVDEETLMNLEYHWAFGGDPYHIKVYNRTTGLNETLAIDGDNIVMRSDDFSWDIFANSSGFSLRKPGTTNIFIFIYGRNLTPYASNTTNIGARLQTVLAPEQVNTTYSIIASADPAEGGTVTGAGTYKEGASITLTATPSEGYEFVNWTEEGEVVSLDNTYTFTASKNRNLVAHFKIGTVFFTCTAGNNFGGDEGIDKMFDDDTSTKFCGFSGDDCYALVTASEPIYVWGYDMTTANDNERYGRCVKRWTLYGTNDANVASDPNAAGWVTLSKFVNNNFVQQKNLYTQRFFCDKGAADIPYQYFKITLNEGDLIQLSEFSFCYEKQRVADYNWYASSDDNSAKALDGLPDPKWEGPDLAGNWVTIEAADGKAHPIKKYMFTTNDDGKWPDRAPMSWKLEGSNDNGTWQVIDEVTDDETIENANYKTYEFVPSNTANAFRYIKLTLNAMKDTGWTQVGEFHVIGISNTSSEEFYAGLVNKAKANPFDRGDLSANDPWYIEYKALYDGLDASLETAINSGNFDQLAQQLQTLTRLVELMTPFRDGANYVAFDGTGCWADSHYSQLFDGKDGREGREATKWGGIFAGNDIAQYVIFRIKEPLQPYFYKLVTGNDTEMHAGRNWKDWRVFGANFNSIDLAAYDADTWVLLDKREDIGEDYLPIEDNYLVTFFFNQIATDPDYYYYFMVEVLNSCTRSDGAQMNELYLSTQADYEDRISTANTSTDDDVIYNLAGLRIPAPQRGINILRMRNGSTRKVLVK